MPKLKKMSTATKSSILSNIPEDRLLTPRDVSKLLGYELSSLAFMRFKGTGPDFIKLPSGQIRYEKKHIADFLNKSI